MDDMPTDRLANIYNYACGHLKGTVYGPEEYLSEKQKPFRRMNYEEYDYYMKKCDESEGFDVDGCTGRMPGRISPLGKGGFEYEVAEVVAKHAAWKQGEAMIVAAYAMVDALNRKGYNGFSFTIPSITSFGSNIWNVFSMGRAPLSDGTVIYARATVWSKQKFSKVKGGLKDDDEVSKDQLGAFFAGMTIRANAFPEATQWSEGERHAMGTFWPELVRVLPHDVLFIADPEGSIMGVSSSIGPNYTGHDSRETRLISVLWVVLAGGHLGYDEVRGVLRDVLSSESGDKGSTWVSESLLSAFLIGQRMNR